YTPGAHEVEVIATDAVGLSSTTVLEIELGQEPLQTHITTPRPSFLANELSKATFTATREGKPVEGATFKCSLAGPEAKEPAMTPCTSPYQLPVPLGPDAYEFKVEAVHGAEVDPTPAAWNFENVVYPPAPAAEKLVYPEEGKKTAGWYTLEAAWGARSGGEGVTGVSFQMQLPGWKDFEPVPTACVIDGHGKQVSWPLPVHSHPGHSSPVYLKVRGCSKFMLPGGYPEKEIRFRAVFDGGKNVAGASAPANTEFVLRNHSNAVATDATETVGPATVDLLTGAYSIS